MAEAEGITAQPEARIQWKTSGTRMRELLDLWKEHQRSGPRLDKDLEAALWQRFSAARNGFDKARRTHFAMLDSAHGEAKRAKEKLVAEAERLANSTDWAPTAGAFKRLMDDWRRAGRASRADDDALWERSIAEVQKVIDITRSLETWFTVTEPPVVICTMGGFTHDAHLPVGARRAAYDRIARALARIDATGVRLTAQTLPPFPWLMGGQQYHNLFMDPEDTVDFCRREGVRLTLDISHTKLASTFARRPFSDYVEAMGPYTDHLHIVDATGVDGEGPQIGDGEVDWPLLAAQLDRLCPGVGFIPEIWQGHVNNGEGFWTALDRLEEWF